MNNQWEMGTAHPALVGHVMVPRWWNESKHRGYFNPTTQPSISSPKYKATRFLLLFGALPTLMTEQRLMPRRPTAHSPRWQPVGESQHGESHGESGRFFLHQLSSVFFYSSKVANPHENWPWSSSLQWNNKRCISSVPLALQFVRPWKPGGLSSHQKNLREVQLRQQHFDIFVSKKSLGVAPSSHDESSWRELHLSSVRATSTSSCGRPARPTNGIHPAAIAKQ